MPNFKCSLATYAFASEHTDTAHFHHQEGFIDSSMLLCSLVNAREHSRFGVEVFLLKR
jgi:hypothetical protein